MKTVKALLLAPIIVPSFIVGIVFGAAADGFCVGLSAAKKWLDEITVVQ